MKKDKTLIVAIATVAILVVMFAGVTYAFFTASNNNISASTVAVTGGAMKITYSDGTNDLGGKLTSTDFQPGNDILVDKIFTLVGKNTATADTGLDMDYYIGIQYESTFSDGQLHWYLKRTDSNSNVTSSIIGDVTSIPGTSETGYNHGTFSPDDIYVKLVTGVFKPNNEEQSITFNLKMQFPDTGVNQDENKGAYFNGKILVNEEPILLSDYIVNLAATETGATYLRYDEMDDSTISSNGKGNLRYYGGSTTDVDAVPNYISFNDELWRIIGVFETVNADTGEKEKSLKIIRSNALGTTSTLDNLNSSTYIEYSWDTSESSINNGHGINEWSQADLMNELNGDYLNTGLTTNPTWYNGSGNTQNAEFDKSQVIKEEYQQYIMNAIWYLGGWNTVNGVSAANMYKYERGIGSTGTIGESYNVYQNASDGVTRTTSWTGKVALMYPSDYGFASNDSTCLNDLYNCDNNNRSNNWLYISKGTGNSNYSEWLLSPYSGGASDAFILYSSGYVVNSYYIVYDYFSVRPVLHLSSDVLIESGTGTSSNPYVLL